MIKSKNSNKRKTLSHLEIESFLFELGGDGTECNRAGTLSTIDSNDTTASARAVINNDENTSPNLVIQSKPVEESIITKPISASSSVKIPIIQEDISDEDSIRKFCKIMFLQPISSPVEELVTISRTIFTSTNYKLLSFRLLHPEKFQHPPNSIQGKKELLISLSPMLLEAEKERKKDTEELQIYTRCHVGKGKSRYSGYEYTDIDINAIIPLEEYKDRYMRFINSKKPESSFSSALSSSAPVVLLPQLSAEEDDISNFYMNDVEMPMQTSDSKKVQARRGTLSPGTARAMIIEAMEEQQIQAQGMGDMTTQIETTSSDERSLLVHSNDPFEATIVIPSVSMHDVPCLCSSTITDEKIKREESLSVAVISASLTCERTTNNNGSISLPIVLDDSFERLLETESAFIMNKATIVQSYGDERDRERETLPLQTEVSFNMDDNIGNDQSKIKEMPTDLFTTLKKIISTEDDVIMATDMAECRLQLRYEQVLWRYHWEVASIHAASLAVKKFGIEPAS